MKIWLDYKPNYPFNTWKRKYRQVEVIFFNKEVLLSKYTAPRIKHYLVFLSENDWQDDCSQYWRINSADVKILFP